MNNSATESLSYTLVYYSGDRQTGEIALVVCEAGRFTVNRLEVAPETGLNKDSRPILVGMTQDQQAILLDPVSRKISLNSSFPADAFPAHIYTDPSSTRAWFMNDGDKETGNDQRNCGDQGSSVTVVTDTSDRAARYLTTTCVGRGHHQACFSYPSESAPGVPHQAYISNLKDGSISVVGNNPDEPEHYLKLVATINLCEPEKEAQGAAAIPNNAFPHGLAYSPLSGKIYNLNNGYGTIAVIDPANNTIEERIGFKGHSNLFVTPDGRYIIGRGADRKSDSQHIIARLTVLDVTTHNIVGEEQLNDIYISKYYFNQDGSKLYLTTGSSGSPEQQEHLKKDALLIFDTTVLPEIRMLREHRLGVPSGSLAFLNQDDSSRLVFSSDSDNGTVTLIDGRTDEILDTLSVTEGRPHSRVWLLG